MVASLFMNVMLVSALVVLWQIRQAPMSLTAPASRPVNATARVKSENSKSKQPAPFRWQQLDAPDFPTFVKNLRAIGCPETTIRDIIQCELNEVYETKQQEIEREIAAAPQQSRAALKERLLQLSTEKMTMLSASLNDSARPAGYVAAAQTSASEAGSEPTSPGAATANTSSARPPIPAAFLVGNDPNRPSAANTLTSAPSDPSLNPATSSVISQIRTDFASALQDVSADPSSPVYRQRWLSAQRASDEQFSSMFGGDYFIQTQLEAVRAAASAANSKP